MTKKTQPQQSVNDKMFSLILIALLVGLGGGYGLAALAENSDDHGVGSIHSENNEDGHSHGDDSMIVPFAVSPEEAPTVDFTVTEDAIHGGWNIKVNTTNFAFTPEKINTDNVVGEGHAHLYVDGEKVARLYGEYFHYSSNFEGTKTFRVTLNANMHGEYTVDGSVVAAEKQVTHDDDSALPQ